MGAGLRFVQMKLQLSLAASASGIWPEKILFAVLAYTASMYAPKSFSLPRQTPRPPNCAALSSSLFTSA